MASADQPFDRFRSYLCFLARAHIGRKMQQQVDASDLVQQTLMDAYVKRHQFRGQTEAEQIAWLRKILSHNLADVVRKQHRAKRDVSREQSLEAAIDDSFHRADGWLEAQQSSPSQRISKKEETLRLANAIEKLPSTQRDAVVLRHLRGLSLAEVANELGRSEQAAAGLIYRGINKLHELLDERT